MTSDGPVTTGNQTTCLGEELCAPLAKTLDEDSVRFAAAYPGTQADYRGPHGFQQPIHTVYGGAHLFRADSSPKLGKLALGSMAALGGDAEAFGTALGIPVALRERVYRRVQQKLASEPVEDQRIDFEDGFGIRSDAEEDSAAIAAAGAVADGEAAGTLSRHLGIRIKALGGHTVRRAMRTLDLFVTTLARRREQAEQREQGASGALFPPSEESQLRRPLLITLPKVTSEAQVGALAWLCTALETRLSLPPMTLLIEIMVEMPQCIVGADGRLLLPHLVDAARGRLAAAHVGSYDYTAGCDVTAGHQRMTHPACDFVRNMMQACLAGRGIYLADGATNVLPIGPHRDRTGEAALTPAQAADNHRVVSAASRLHFDQIRDSLDRGFYQGWDLHPAQIPIRYAAVYTFIFEQLDISSNRLRTFLANAAQASRVGAVFDDAATALGLVNFFLRAEGTGAHDARDVETLTGVTVAALRTRSFQHLTSARHPPRSPHEG